MSLEHEDHEQCWCLPDVMNVCPECEDWDDPNPECWRCQGDGYVPAYDRAMPIIVIHNDVSPD